jgi:PadR family transcriptional regulator PadR
LDNLQKQFKKGVLDLLVLDLLNHGDAYGYEIISQLDKASDGYYLMKEGSLYPVLYRLEDKNLIQNYRQPSEADRAVPRKYYKITEDGIQQLALMKAEWQQFYQITNHVLKG